MSGIRSSTPAVIHELNQINPWKHSAQNIEAEVLKVAIDWLSEHKDSLEDYRQAIINLTFCAAQLPFPEESSVYKIRQLVSSLKLGADEWSLVKKRLSTLYTPQEKAFKEVLTLRNVASFFRG